MPKNKSPNKLAPAKQGAPAQGEQEAFVTFTRRTDDPKLAWLEKKLDEAGIAHKRDGFSYHAPILKVPASQLEAAEKILEPIDEIADDDPRFSGSDL